MAKKITKEINVQVASKKQGYWVNQDNIRKGERTIKTTQDKSLVKRDRSGYDYSKTITGYEQTKADLELQFAKKLRTQPRGARQDLSRRAKNTQEAPVVTAKSFFDFRRGDIKGIDTPKVESKPKKEGDKDSWLKRAIKEEMKKEQEQLTKEKETKEQFQPAEHYKSSGFKLGEKYLLRQTANYRQHQFIVEVTKINPKSVRIRVVDPLGSNWAIGQSWSHTISKQTKNNGIYELMNKEAVKAVDKGKIDVSITDTKYEDRSKFGEAGLTWMRQDKTWKGKVSPEKLKELKQIGTVKEIDRSITHDDLVRTQEIKKENKTIQLEKRVLKLQQEYDTLDEWMSNSPEAQFLVMGEPIKVGHHSEKRHRATIKRFNTKDKKRRETREALDKSKGQLSRLMDISYEELDTLVPKKKYKVGTGWYYKPRETAGEENPDYSKLKTRKKDSPEARITELNKGFTKLHAKYDPLLEKSRHTNKKEYSKLLNELDSKKEDLYREIEREKTKVMNAKQKEVIPETKPKTKPDTSKSKAIGKELYSDKYNPKKTHLALTTSMNDMQKRRLIKLAMNNGIDTREIDPSLKYDENIEVLKNMVEHQEGKFANREEDERWFKGAVKSTDLNYHFSTTVPQKERDIDLLTTEKKLVTEKDIEHGRKEKMIQKWKGDPLKSDIDIENIDDKWDQNPKTTTTKPKPKPKSKPKRNFISEYKAVQKQIDQKKIANQELYAEERKLYKKTDETLSDNEEEKTWERIGVVEENQLQNAKEIEELEQQKNTIYRPEKDLSQAEQENLREYARSKNIKYPPISNRRIEFQKQEIDALANPTTAKSQKTLLEKDRAPGNVYIPDSRFWDTWKTDKEAMKKNGIQTRKIDDTWIVIIDD